MQNERKSVTITTSYLSPGCTAQSMLEDAGFAVHFSSEAPRKKLGSPLHEQVAETHALILGTEPLTDQDFASISGLQVVARTGAGYDNVDVASATKHAVTVCNTPGANRQSVVELALGLMLSLARDLPGNIANTRLGQWSQGSGRELCGSTLGIIGMGDIGRAVARTAQALGMAVIAHDPGVTPETLTDIGVQPVSFEELLSGADFITLHLALTPKTRGLINSAAFKQMKSSAFLVNTSRGGIVQESDLVEALNAGTIAGAALDVIEEEPISSDNPLCTAPNLLLTAHIAGATVQARERSAGLAAQQIIDYFAGAKPQHQVST